MTRSRVRAAAVAAAAGLAVTAVAVGGALGAGKLAGEDGGSSSFAQPASAAVGADEPWATRASAIFAAWAGSPEEQQAAEVVVAYMLNGKYSDCMDGKDYPRPWEASIMPPPVYKDPLLYSFWAAGRLDGYFAQKVVNGEIGQRQEHAANAIDARGDEAAAELACRREHPAASDGDVNEVRVPKVVEELSAAWVEALVPVLVAGGDLDTYEKCIKDTGVLDRLGVRTSEAAREKLSSLMDPGAVPLGEEPETKEWAEYLEREHAYVDADWSCREDIRATLDDEVTIALDRFEDEQGDAIAQARSRWEAVTAQASKLGWTPGRIYTADWPTAAGRSVDP